MAETIPERGARSLPRLFIGTVRRLQRGQSCHGGDFACLD